MELRIDRFDRWAFAGQYHAAEELMPGQGLPPDSSPGTTSHGSGSSGWGARIPLGVRARDHAGMVEVVPSSVHRKLRKTRTMIMPMDIDELRPSKMASSTCSICFTEDLKDPVCFECGTHTFCRHCMRQHCQTCLGHGSVPICPMEGCKAEAGVELLTGLLPAHEFEKYLLVSLRVTKRYKTCPRPECGAPVYVEEKALAAAAAGKSFQPGLNTAVRCPECRKSFCMVCSQPAHPRYTCEQARRRAAKRGQGQCQVQEILSDGLEIKACPRCGVSICKATNDDCDHMVCQECKKEFCWICFEDRDVVLAHGCHYHAPSCKHHAAYAGPLEFLPNQCRECKRTGKPCKPPRK